ncbi:DUF1450 domain-containing protein [Enterococcus sp. LJL120]
MDPLLEFCEQNLSAGSQLVIDDAFVSENCDIMTYSCMSECTLCGMKPFAFFEGERIAANTPEGLLVSVTAAIKEWQAEYGM